MLAFTLFIAGCAKDGAVGPQGEKGDKGDQGEQGVQGAAGKDGTLVRYGNGWPPQDFGNNGDFYIDMNNNSLHGPKVNGSWSFEPILLKGEKGDSGSQFLSGNGLPAGSLGNDGDFYFDRTNVTLYGPKTAGVWTFPVPLRQEANDIVTVLYTNYGFSNFIQASQDAYTHMVYSIRQLTVSLPTGFNADEGLIIFQFKSRNSSSESAFWATGEITHGANMWQGNDQFTSKVTIEGFSKSGVLTLLNETRVVNIGGSGYLPIDSYTTQQIETHVNTFGRIDIKITFIPAGKVQQLSAKKIDIKNVDALLKAIDYR